MPKSKSMKHPARVPLKTLNHELSLTVFRFYSHGTHVRFSGSKFPYVFKIGNSCASQKFQIFMSRPRQHTAL